MHEQGLSPLIERLTVSSVVRDLGTGRWVAGAIPFEHVYSSKEPAYQSLSSFVEEILQAAAPKDDHEAGALNEARVVVGPALPPPYIFDVHFHLGKEGPFPAVGTTDDLFPEVPRFAQAAGLPGVAAVGTSSETFRTQFYLGQPGTGAPMHYHNLAWNALVYGKKAWVLTSPEVGKFSNVPSSTEIHEFATRTKNETSSPKLDDSKGGRTLRCVQNQGDVVVLPENWSHMTYNLRAAIGIAREFDLRPYPSLPAQTTKVAIEPPNPTSVTAVEEF